MMAIGSYFAFIIFVMGTVSATHISKEERKQFFDDMVSAHNDFRKLHHVDDLDLDEQICDLIKVHTDLLEANEETVIPTNYGINFISIKFKDKPVLNANEIVSLWYSKSDGYDYNTEPQSPSKEIDAFTQLVWKNTKKMGVGMWIKDKSCLVIAAYSPRGNQREQYTSNVLRPRSGDNPNE